MNKRWGEISFFKQHISLLTHIWMVLSRPVFFFWKSMGTHVWWLHVGGRSNAVRICKI